MKNWRWVHGEATLDNGKPTLDNGKPTQDKRTPTLDNGKPTLHKWTTIWDTTWDNNIGPYHGKMSWKNNMGQQKMTKKGDHDIEKPNGTMKWDKNM